MLKIELRNKGPLDKAELENLRQLVSVGITFGGTLIAASIWLFSTCMENIRCQFWPQIDGSVVAFEIIEDFGEKRIRPDYKVGIRYEFIVNGVTHQGTRFNTRYNFVSEEVSDKLVRQYQPLAKCSVTYNPAHPDSSYIDPSITYHTWGRLGMGIVAGLAGMIFLFMARISHRSLRAAKAML